MNSTRDARSNTWSGIRSDVEKPRMEKNSVLDAFNVLDVQSRVDIDACFQKFLDILAAFSVAGSIYVGVGQVLDQDQLRPSFDAGVQI